MKNNHNSNNKKNLSIVILVIGVLIISSLFIFNSLPKLQYASFPVSDLIDGVELSTEGAENIPETFSNVVQQYQTSLELEATLNEIDKMRDIPNLFNEEQTQD